MTYSQFTSIINTQKRPVILLEGSRNISIEHTQLVTAFARKLALDFPDALFRSGNAAGADDAFAAGIIAVDPSRIQYILPNARSRKKFRLLSAPVLSLEELSTETIELLVVETCLATPDYASMIKNRHKSARLTNMSAYLLRDTLKIVGHGETFLPATFGIFYVNSENPTGGGTGHTIRVCQRHNVAVVTQNDWMKW